MSLNIHKTEPASAIAKQLLVFIHGYGADGRDLLGLAQPMAQVFPDMMFVAPDAPSQCAASPMGYQWFPIPWLDGTDPTQAQIAMGSAVAQFDAFLDQLSADTGVAAEQTILFGFSQGTMMALHIGPRRMHQLGGIVGFSGRLLQGDSLLKQTQSRPPIQLLHGDCDEVVPYSDMKEAEQTLRDAQFDVRSYTMVGTGHGIAPDGLQVAVDFIRHILG